MPLGVVGLGIAVPHPGSQDVFPDLKRPFVIRVNRPEDKHGDGHVRRHVDAKLGKLLGLSEASGAQLRASDDLLPRSLRVEVVPKLWHRTCIQQLREGTQRPHMNVVQSQGDGSVASHERSAAYHDLVVQLDSKQGRDLRVGAGAQHCSQVHVGLPRRERATSTPEPLQPRCARNDRVRGVAWAEDDRPTTEHSADQPLSFEGLICTMHGRSGPLACSDLRLDGGQSVIWGVDPIGDLRGDFVGDLPPLRRLLGRRHGDSLFEVSPVKRILEGLTTLLEGFIVVVVPPLLHVER